MSRRTPLSFILNLRSSPQAGWREFTYNMVMIHCKVVVIDPFGKHPVLMTGSHNMGPKASASTTT
jgi:hypothetical protein